MTVGTAWQDAAGNAGAGGSDTVTIDTLNPTVAVNIVDASLSDADNSSEVTFTFSEAPINFDADDISAVGGHGQRAHGTANPLVYTATFTATDGFSGTGSVTVGTAWQDAAGNAGVGGSDTVAHRHAEPDGCGEHRRWLAERCRQQLGSDLHLQRGADQLRRRRHFGGRRRGQRASRQPANPLVYTATFTATDGFSNTGSVTVGTAWQDAAGNAGVGGSDTVTIDTLNPTVAVNIVDGSLSDGDNSSLVTFTFSEAPTNFDAADISAVGGRGQRAHGNRQSAGLYRDLHGD